MCENKIGTFEFVNDVICGIEHFKKWGIEDQVCSSKIGDERENCEKLLCRLNEAKDDMRGDSQYKFARRLIKIFIKFVEIDLEHDTYCFSGSDGLLYRLMVNWKFNPFGRGYFDIDLDSVDYDNINSYLKSIIRKLEEQKKYEKYNHNHLEVLFIKCLLVLFKKEFTVDRYVDKYREFFKDDS